MTVFETESANFEAGSPIEGLADRSPIVVSLDENQFRAQTMQRGDPGGGLVPVVGPDGVLRGLEQRLNYQNIHSVPKGMSKDEVRRLLGPPNEISRLPRQQREVWEYPWIHAVREGRVLWVQFSDDGIVREAIEMHDYERDPENDFSSLRSSLLSTLP